MVTAPNAVDRLIGARVADERARRGLPAAVLAKRAGMQATSLQMAEIGLERLSAFDMMMLLRALDKRPAWLFAGVGFDAG